MNKHLFRLLVVGTACLLQAVLSLSCGPADDAGSARSGSTAAAGSEAVQAPATGVLANDSAAAVVATATRARAVFLGTSLTAGFGLLRDSERFTDLLQAMADSAGIPVLIVNAGLSGDTSAGGLRRLEWALRDGADLLFIELGANDGLRGQSVPAMKQNLTSIIQRARAQLPGIFIVLAGMEMPPNLGARYTRDFRDAFPELAREQDVLLVPFLLEGVGGTADLNQSDGIHPNVAGHQHIARTLWPILEPVFREVAATHPEPR